MLFFTGKPTIFAVFGDCTPGDCTTAPRSHKRPRGPGATAPGTACTCARGLRDYPFFVHVIAQVRLTRACWRCCPTGDSSVHPVAMPPAKRARKSSPQSSADVRIDALLADVQPGAAASVLMIAAMEWDASDNSFTREGKPAHDFFSRLKAWVSALESAEDSVAKDLFEEAMAKPDETALEEVGFLQRSGVIEDDEEAAMRAAATEDRRRMLFVTLLADSEKVEDEEEEGEDDEDGEEADDAEVDDDEEEGEDAEEGEEEGEEEETAKR